MEYFLCTMWRIKGHTITFINGLGEVQEHVPDQAVKMLVGAKYDLKDKRVVTTDTARKFAGKLFIYFFFKHITREDMVNS